MFIVTVHYWEDDGEGAAPRIESIEAKFSNEHAGTSKKKSSGKTPNWSNAPP